MFKFIKIFFAIAVFFVSQAAEAQTVQKDTLYVLGFRNYPPFGMVEDGKFRSIFTFLIKEVTKKPPKTAKGLAGSKWEVYYENEKDYEDVLATIRQEGDLVLGAYRDDEVYKKIEILYPAIIQNSVKVMMLPRRIDEVKSIKDLENLRGGVNTSEVFSDFVRKQIATYNPVEADNSLVLFEKLFAGEIDYIFTGYYFGLREAIRLGLRNQISFSKKDMWKVPLFIGISQKSRKYKALKPALESILKDESLSAKVEEEIKKAMTETEERYFGVIPPLFVKSNKE